MLAGGIMMGFGTLSVAYFIFYALKVDLNNVFTYFWLLLGLGLLLAGYLVYRLYHKGDRLPKRVLIPAGAAGGLVVLFFAVMIGLIAREAYHQPKPGADYMIVLGARVRGDRISALLKYRLDKAYEYLSDNPDTIVVVSGGQGPGEKLTEAEAMQDYLIEKGIDSERILTEDASLNTDQNIRNSIALISENEVQKGDGEGAKRLVLLSNGFHLFRATRILKKQLQDDLESGKKDGIADGAVIEGLGAKTKWYVVPNSYVREVFAVVKYKLSGQI